MADIDVGVLSLAVPPQSAPKAIYCPAVRVKNYGIQARVATGYVRIYDKNTGQLVQSFDVVSQELDAGQEGNAVSAASWDLTEAEVGKQYIVSGWCSCDGDMVPGNNVLDSTVLTVADTPPPPPPPVEPHASQHEHGGDDQLNLDGLHGQPADPQPYADHASKHQDDGTDQLNISGLAGRAADPQIAADHGNERHIVSFATAADLTNHENDNDTHAAAENLEHVAQKGQVDGYAGLDENGLIDPAKLAPAEVDLRFLRNDQTWQPGVAAPFGSPVVNSPGTLPSNGVSAEVARADHNHGGPGCVGCARVRSVSAGNDTFIVRAPVPIGFASACSSYALTLIGSYQSGENPGNIVVLTRCGQNPDWPVIRGDCSIPVVTEIERAGWQFTGILYTVAGLCYAGGSIVRGGRTANPDLVLGPHCNAGSVWQQGSQLNHSLVNYVVLTIEISGVGNSLSDVIGVIESVQRCIPV